ncbi:hypothetical protein [Nonomuraea ferruginea]|uniref:Uncharacterized protein n=1 Tax=Nonomuraea ferruginea TaxID=46174 RepID=A0ABT4TAQ4_9ACTN|nr:hypothetical protein [Nonomuraea ferruginea]MDA0646525.1 hypothetical protein [Nonomuraea ferruginea]
MSENPGDTSPAADGLGAESDVVAERSGASTEKSRRPIPADPPEARDEPEWPDEDRPEERDHAEGEEERPDIGPTG